MNKVLALEGKKWFVNSNYELTPERSLAKVFNLEDEEDVTEFMQHLYESDYVVMDVEHLMEDV